MADDYRGVMVDYVPFLLSRSVNVGAVDGAILSEIEVVEEYDTENKLLHGIQILNNGTPPRTVVHTQPRKYEEPVGRGYRQLWNVFVGIGRWAENCSDQYLAEYGLPSDYDGVVPVAAYGFAASSDLEAGQGYELSWAGRGEEETDAAKQLALALFNVDAAEEWIGH